MSANSRLKATKIIGQRKAFCRQRIPESNCARKETVYINIIVTYKNGERIREWNLENKVMEPVQPD